jgi:transcriptional regulator with XRE-family HTH domain
MGVEKQGERKIMTPDDLLIYRLSLKFSTRAMGEHLGISGAAVSQLEKGQYPPSKTLVKLISSLKKIEELQAAMVAPEIPAASLKLGDTAFVNRRVKVVITRAAPDRYTGDRYTGDYRCGKCGGAIKALSLHGSSRDGRHFCIRCCGR